MSKKLLAKAGMIQLPPASTNLAPRSAEGDVRTKTAPGTMLHFMTSQSAAMQEAEELRDRLQAFEGASPSRPVDPKLIRPSKWANRHEASFGTPEFEALKAEIGSAGRNVQAIKVRPVQDGKGEGADATALYEIVYGHRRHRACLELGIPVHAVIEESTDQELFAAMERENRGRQSLSAWEQGMMYRRALDHGLYPSMRKLAEGLDVDLSLVSKSLTLARLPEAVVSAFASPLQIQFRWAQPLSEALQKDPDSVLARAKAAQGRGLQASQVVALLLNGEGVLNGSTPQKPVEIKIGKKRAAKITEDPKGRLTVQFEPGVLSPEKRERLSTLVKELVSE
jgi:ParB family transcriptional regulator, chromosome partitioning protein